ncbi:hypothetical protein PTI98_002687 [Pleurotus ostreatus]|nr:hypothetical protein PTI98_002687 [Pleurotus ostreatus]
MLPNSIRDAVLGPPTITRHDPLPRRATRGHILPLYLLSVLREAASTVRSLTLEDIMLDDPPTSIRGGPVRMTVLQELAIVLWGKLPLVSEFVLMPSLKT